MASELLDNNFNNNLDLVNTTFYPLIIGYTNECPRCTALRNNLNSNHVTYGEVNLRNNPQFLRNVATKNNLTSITMPIVLLYKNGKYNKKITNTLPVAEIIQEINSL
jgi:glutaredoxin